MFLHQKTTIGLLLCLNHPDRKQPCRRLMATHELNRTQAHKPLTATTRACSKTTQHMERRYAHTNTNMHAAGQHTGGGKTQGGDNRSHLIYMERCTNCRKNTHLLQPHPAWQARQAQQASNGNNTSGLFFEFFFAVASTHATDGSAEHNNAEALPRRSGACTQNTAHMS